MRVRVATTALGITGALLALPACSTGDQRSSAARAGTPSDHAQQTAVLSSAALESRLLASSDLGNGYLPKPERPAPHDDVTVLGCPALNNLGGDAATGARSTFPARRKQPSPTATAPRRYPKSCTATARKSSPTASLGSSTP
ncbi:hypothetical protein [Streptomyces olivaceus]|uniref:hypothetical protein n=1 Tax=Streptomyces olivaceus TaxID=47716 RepID=UPI00365F6B1D